MSNKQNLKSLSEYVEYAIRQSLNGTPITKEIEDKIKDETLIIYADFIKEYGYDFKPYLLSVEELDVLANIAHQRAIYIQKAPANDSFPLIWQIESIIDKHLSNTKEIIMDEISHLIETENMKKTK